MPNENCLHNVQKILVVSPELIWHNLQAATISEQCHSSGSSQRPLTAEDRAQSQASPRGVYELSLRYCHSTIVPSPSFHLQPTLYTASNRQRHYVKHLKEIIAAS